ncbi:MAG: hypothetical protein PVH50_02590 [Anaerolineae bacterium]
MAGLSGAAVEEGDLSEDEANWLLDGLERGHMPGRGLGHGFGHVGRSPGMRGGIGEFAPCGVAPQQESSDTQTPARRSSSAL